jgi:hypothetical protein
MGARALVLAGLLAVIGATGSAQTAAPPPPADDPFTWLEEMHGERALAWARAENARTLGDLQGDPRYQANYDRALQIVQARDRIPAVSMRPDGLYNFWQDSEHVQGILRRTSAIAWSASPTAAATPISSASSIFASAASSRVDSACPRASRAQPGRMRTRSWSSANGGRER